jgi:hypothetical protein
MATDRQIAANLKNAARSTGPRTVEGKARSRSNATKHGMAAEEIVIVNDNDRKMLAIRKTAWAREYRVEGETADWALDRMVAASFRIERCEDAFHGVISDRAERAILAWDQDRRVEAATIATKLARDPVLGAAMLEASWHGCGLMVEIWARLDAALEAKGEWSELEHATALDLLGVPAHLRDGRSSIDPPEGCSDAVTYRREYVAETVELLEAKQDGLADLDARRRGRAEAGVDGIDSPEARRVLRYERDAWRRYREARSDLLHPQTVVVPPPEPAPAPAPPPVPWNLPVASQPAVAVKKVVAAAPMVGKRSDLDRLVAIDQPAVAFSYVDISATRPSAIPLRV